MSELLVSDLRSLTDTSVNYNVQVFTWRQLRKDFEQVVHGGQLRFVCKVKAGKTLLQIPVYGNGTPPEAERVCRDMIEYWFLLFLDGILEGSDGLGIGNFDLKYLLGIVAD
jgi:hypothetical protein